MKPLAFATLLISSILSATTIASAASNSLSSVSNSECPRGEDQSQCLKLTNGLECRELNPGLFSISHIVRRPNNELKSAEFYKKLVWNGQVVTEEKTHALEGAFDIAIYKNGYRYHAFGEKTDYTEERVPFEASEFKQGVCMEYFTGMVYHYQ